MGLFDDIKEKVGEENFKKAESFLSDNKSAEEKPEQTAEGEQKSESTGSRYVDKIESFIGEEKINQIKSKVGEDNYTKAENAIEEQIKSRFGGDKQ